MGLGKQNLRVFEEHQWDKGFKEIGLRVVDDNTVPPYLRELWIRGYWCQHE